MYFSQKQKKNEKNINAKIKTPGKRCFSQQVSSSSSKKLKREQFCPNCQLSLTNYTKISGNEIESHMTVCLAKDLTKIPGILKVFIYIG